MYRSSPDPCAERTQIADRMGGATQSSAELQLTKPDSYLLTNYVLLGRCSIGVRREIARGATEGGRHSGMAQCDRGTG